MERIKIDGAYHEIISINKRGSLLEIEFTSVTDLSNKDLSLIEVFTSGGIKCTEITGFTTVYHSENTIVILSNDGSVYSEPVPDETIPTEPYVPTLAEIQISKINEMNSICNQQILAGFTSKAFDGATELPYDSDTLSQLDLNGLVSIAQLRISGFSTEMLKWKNANQISCVEWTPEQILMLGLDMKRHIERNKDRYHSLKIYINGLTDIADVNAVTWDVVIP